MCQCEREQGVCGQLRRREKTWVLRGRGQKNARESEGKQQSPLLFI